MLWQGITYDTGGADIKAGGIMAGMHRDKCGSAAVAGFFQVPITYAPALFTDENIRVGYQCFLLLLFFLALSQTKAQTPEGCRCNGNGAKQCRIW